MVMQPKSSATVVVVFPGVWLVRSIPAPACVIAASVVSTGISEIDDTAVVLPTPNPPAITILTGNGGRAPVTTGGQASADGLESTDDPLDDLHVVVEPAVRPAYGQVPECDQVGGERTGPPSGEQVRA